MVSVLAVPGQAMYVHPVSARLSVQDTSKEKRGRRTVEKQKRRSSSLPMTRGRARKKYGYPEGFTQVEKRESVVLTLIANKILWHLSRPMTILIIDKKKR